MTFQPHSVILLFEFCILYNASQTKPLFKKTSGGVIQFFLTPCEGFVLEVDGLLIAGLGKLRIYDQALALLSMLVILVSFLKSGEHMRAMGATLMFVGSVLFVIKFSIPPWLVPGDFLHLAMAFGLLLVAPNNLKLLEESSAPETA